MKKTLIALLLLLAGGMTMNAADYEQWVYLNNGNVIYGFVESTPTGITVTTGDGHVFTYPLAEVLKITDEKEATPVIGRDRDLENYSTYQRGFWIAGQLSGAYTLNLTKKNVPMVELDVVGGYRFNEYLRAGIGFGGRYYINNDHMRDSHIAWAFPLYANVRGNIIPTAYHTVVPYYSLDIGGAIRDGFMWRPTIGMRVGQARSAFLLGLTYTGQCYKAVGGKNRYGSFLGLTLGYEY